MSTQTNYTVSVNDHIIQVRLMKVEKNSVMVSRVFRILSEEGVVVDMISSVMLESEMRIDFTCDENDQSKLNKALAKLHEDNPRIEAYSTKSSGKLSVEGSAMVEEAGVAAKIFEILGTHQIPFSQVTTGDTSISYVIEKKYLAKAEETIKEALS